MGVVNVSVHVSKTSDKSENLVVMKALMECKKIVIGVTESTNGRSDDLSNAFLAHFHHQGCPDENIPSRPIFPNAVTDNFQLALLPHCKKAFENALDCVFPDTELENAGEAAAHEVHNYFAFHNDWKRNRPYTIKKKGFDQPLVETGELMSSITSEVREE